MYGLGGAVLRGRVDEVLAIIGLADRQHRRVDTFSGGMKRRVNIGVALLHHPCVVIMDEPTVGIDPQSRRHIQDTVKFLNGRGMIVLYTTHYMEEAQELSQRIVIMDQGKVIAAGTHQDLVRIAGQQDRIDLKLSQDAATGAGAAGAWAAIQGVSRVSAHNGTLTMLAEDSDLVLPRLFESAPRLGVHITSVDVQEPNLEAVFLHLTGKALRN